MPIGVKRVKEAQSLRGRRIGRPRGVLSREWGEANAYARETYSEKGW